MCSPCAAMSTKKAERKPPVSGVAPARNRLAKSASSSPMNTAPRTMAAAMPAINPARLPRFSATVARL